MTITDFLLARIAEDEEYARGSADHGAPRAYSRDDDGSLMVDPARVLAECEAKRRIVDACRPLVAVVYRESDRLAAIASGEGSVPLIAYSEPHETSPAADTVLRLLALPYADHPDYDEAWRVE